MSLASDLMKLNEEGNIFDSGDPLDTMLLCDESLYAREDELFNPQKTALNESVLNEIDSEIVDMDEIGEDNSITNIMDISMDENEPDLSPDGMEAEEYLQSTQDYLDGSADYDSDCIDAVIAAEI